MDNLLAIVDNNPLDLTPQEIGEIKRSIQRNVIGPLSPEKEAAPFLFYCFGDSIEEICKKTSYPKDIILVTAMYYNWPEKAKQIDVDIEDLQKKIAEMTLMGTYLQVQKEIAEVLSGKKDPKTAAFLPKNIHGLEKLMNLVDSIKEKPAAAPTTINAQNVQINNQYAEMKDELEDPERLEERKRKIEAMKKFDPK